VPNPMARDVRERGATAAHRSAAARGRGSPALALDGAPGHLLDRELEQNAARALAHVTKGSGGDRASPAAGTVRGRCGHSGELGETLLCAKQRGIGQGFFLTACRGRRRAQKRREGAGGEAWQRRRIGRRSGVVGARLPRASGTGTCDSTCLLSSWQPHESKRRSEDQSFTGGDELTAAAGTRGGDAGKLGHTCVCWCVAEAKGGVGARVRA
jgi:hypothetical protein